MKMEMQALAGTDEVLQKHEVTADAVDQYEEPSDTVEASNPNPAPTVQPAARKGLTPLSCLALALQLQLKSTTANAAFKVWALGTGRCHGEATTDLAAPASAIERGSPHENTKRQPPVSGNSSFWRNSPAFASPKLHGRADGLPARPEDAHIRHQRVSLVPADLPPRPFAASSATPASTVGLAANLSQYECCCPFVDHSPSQRARSGIMGLSKSRKIQILLVVDSLFFLLEIFSGYYVHSLALVADAFHMLNDVVSLIVGLWAVKVAKTGRSSNYTYGWQRAETIGALFNGVFLVALCLSIFLDAISRFVEPQIVTNPKLVLVVGCLGLASNIFGLILFADSGGHAHSHGDEDHSHDAVKSAEEGRGEATETTGLLKDQDGGQKGTRTFSRSDESRTTENSAAVNRKSQTSGSGHRRRASLFTGNIEDMPIHPAARRDEIFYAAQIESAESSNDEAIDSNDESPSNGKATAPQYSHAQHKHRQPKQKAHGGGLGHNHGDLNMRGVFLHVLGDALGNIGVIITALIIWFAKFPGRYYFDPAISLVITLIILKTAIPLCQAAARILLQAVPAGMSIEEIRADIEDLEGVCSAHHIHVWQLSDTKVVASLHVKISSEIENAGTEGYMNLAKEIQQCLKEYGIRSSTIQPEFEAHSEHREHAAPGTVKTASIRSKDDDKCILGSEDAGAAAPSKAQGHDHDHDHDHNDEHDHGHDDHNHSHNHAAGKGKHSHQH